MTRKFEAHFDKIKFEFPFCHFFKLTRKGKISVFIRLNARGLNNFSEVAYYYEIHSSDIALINDLNE